MVHASWLRQMEAYLKDVGMTGCLIKKIPNIILIILGQSTKEKKHCNEISRVVERRYGSR